MKSPARQAEYRRRHYEANRDEYIARAVARGRTPEGRAYFREYHKKRREWVTQLKTNSPCMDCGVAFHPAAMQFDHRPGEQKRFNVGNCTHHPRVVVEAEIAKCDLVCANCHAVRTFERRRPA